MMSYKKKSSNLKQKKGLKCFTLCLLSPEYMTVYDCGRAEGRYQPTWALLTPQLIASMPGAVIHGKVKVLNI